MRPIRSPPSTSMHFSVFRKPSDSSITRNGRQSSLARSRPSIPPRVYSVRRIMSLRKPRARPVCCSVSGALGASGSPPMSQSMLLIFAGCTAKLLHLTPSAGELLHQDQQRQAHDDDADLDDPAAAAHAGEKP